MSVNKYKGKVILKKTGGISKSAHDAVCLKTRENTYELRKRGVNPFENSPFQKWIGKEVTVDGKLKENILFVEEIGYSGDGDETDNYEADSSDSGE